jgi:uncharacterized delta-60 repeat protein
MALQPDQRIVVVGESSHSFLVMRLNGNGSLDASFNSTGYLTALPPDGLNGNANAVVLQPDGALVVAGGALVDDGDVNRVKAAIARFSDTGTLDPTFGSSGWATISALNSATDIVLHPGTGGAFDVAGVFDSSAAVGRLLPDGSLDTNFGTNAGLSYFAANNNPFNEFQGLALQGDGNIVVTGDTIASGSTRRSIVVARYFGVTTASASPAGLTSSDPRGSALVPAEPTRAGTSQPTRPALPAAREALPASLPPSFEGDSPALDGLAQPTSTRYPKPSTCGVDAVFTELAEDEQGVLVPF